jgi:hypothetical protein
MKLHIDVQLRTYVQFHTNMQLHIHGHFNSYIIVQLHNSKLRSMTHIANWCATAHYCAIKC